MAQIIYFHVSNTINDRKTSTNKKFKGKQTIREVYWMGSIYLAELGTPTSIAREGTRGERSKIEPPGRTPFLFISCKVSLDYLVAHRPP
jgi:hypothetical protein